MNDTGYVTRCHPQPNGIADIDAELRAAGLVGPGESDAWYSTHPSTYLPPESEGREVVPEGQSPLEIADRGREQGMTVTQEEATGWA